MGEMGVLPASARREEVRNVRPPKVRGERIDLIEHEDPSREVRRERQCARAHQQPERLRRADEDRGRLVEELEEHTVVHLSHGRHDLDRVALLVGPAVAGEQLQDLERLQAQLTRRSAHDRLNSSGVLAEPREHGQSVRERLAGAGGPAEEGGARGRGRLARRAREQRVERRTLHGSRPHDARLGEPAAEVGRDAERRKGATDGRHERHGRGDATLLLHEPTPHRSSPTAEIEAPRARLSAVVQWLI